MLYTMVRERKKMVNFIDVQEAVRQYGPGVMGEGPQLPHPLCGQCVLTDGRNMTLMWLQVSNLNVGEEEEEGVEGIWWQLRDWGHCMKTQTWSGGGRREKWWISMRTLSELY